MDIGLRMLNYKTRVYRPLAMMDDISISKKEWRQLKMIDLEGDSLEEDDETYPDDPIIAEYTTALPVSFAFCVT